MIYVYSLLNYLKSKSYLEEFQLLCFASEAYNKKWRQKVEDAAKSNTRPFASWFNGKRRLYFLLQRSEQDTEKVDEEVEQALLDYDYKIIDYLNGYCERNGVSYRIGKIINKLKEMELKEAVDEKDESEIKNKWLLINNIFINSAFRIDKNINRDLYIVISQDPHDIAKMSFERRWTSCMNIAEHSDDIFCEVSEGGLVAYLVSKDDKSIENPLARIAIRRFVNEGGKNIAVPENQVYGINIPGFLEFVKNWTNEQNKKMVERKNVPEVYTLKGRKGSDSFEHMESFLIYLNELSFDELKNIYINKYKDIYYISDLYFDSLQEEGYYDFLLSSRGDIESKILKAPLIKELKNKGGVFLTNKPQELLEELKNLDVENKWLNYILGLDMLIEEEYDNNHQEMINSRFQISDASTTVFANLRSSILKLLIKKYFDKIDINFASHIFNEIKDRVGNTLINSHYKMISDELLFLIKKFPKLIDLKLFLALDPEQKNNIIEYFGEEDLSDELSEYFNLIKNELGNISAKPLNTIVSSFLLENIIESIYNGPATDEILYEANEYLNSLMIEDNKYINFKIILNNIKNIERKINLVGNILHNYRSKWRGEENNIYDILSSLYKDVASNLIKKKDLRPLLPILEELFLNIEKDCALNKESYLDQYNYLREALSREDITLNALEIQKDAEVAYRKKFLTRFIKFINS